MGLVESANVELAAVESLIKKHGGVDGLIRQFEKQGLGSVARSWTGNGQSHPISSDQIYRALGYETLQQLGSKLGLGASEVAAHLSTSLPKAVANLTSRGSRVYKGATEARYPWTGRKKTL